MNRIRIEWGRVLPIIVAWVIVAGAFWLGVEAASASPPPLTGADARLASHAYLARSYNAGASTGFQVGDCTRHKPDWIRCSTTEYEVEFSGFFGDLHQGLDVRRQSGEWTTVQGTLLAGTLWVRP